MDVITCFMLFPVSGVNRKRAVIRSAKTSSYNPFVVRKRKKNLFFRLLKLGGCPARDELNPRAQREKRRFESGHCTFRSKTSCFFVKFILKAAAPLSGAPPLHTASEKERGARRATKRPNERCFFFFKNKKRGGGPGDALDTAPPAERRAQSRK